MFLQRSLWHSPKSSAICRSHRYSSTKAVLFFSWTFESNHLASASTTATLTRGTNVTLCMQPSLPRTPDKRIKVWNKIIHLKNKKSTESTHAWTLVQQLGIRACHRLWQRGLWRRAGRGARHRNLRCSYCTELQKTIAHKRGGERSQPWKFLKAWGNSPGSLGQALYSLDKSIAIIFQALWVLLVWSYLEQKERTFTKGLAKDSSLSFLWDKRKWSKLQHLLQL